MSDFKVTDIDRFGNVIPGGRSNRVLKNGEGIRVPITLMDGRTVPDRAQAAPMSEEERRVHRAQAWMDHYATQHEEQQRRIEADPRLAAYHNQYKRA